MNSSIYNYILNPSSNRWVNINGNLGKQILSCYVTQLGGASLDKGSPVKSNDAVASLNSKTVFIINGAPTDNSFEGLIKVHQDHTDVRIVICASLETFQAAQEKMTEEHDYTVEGDIYNLPTNFRAPHETTAGKNPILNNYGEVHDVNSFKEAQFVVTSALVNILNYADFNKIPTYFGIVPRNERPTYIQLSKTDGLVEFTDYKGVRNKKLTELVIENLLKKTFGEGGNPTIEEALSKYTSHSASFLADVLTICCALLIEDTDCWTQYSLVRSKDDSSGAIIDYAKHFSKKIFAEDDDEKEIRDAFEKEPQRKHEGYAFCRTKFIPDVNGTFYSFKSGSKDKIEATLTDLVINFPTNDIKKVWDLCFMVCDTFLNDIDDLPANALADALSKKYIEQINYSVCDQRP